MTIRMNQARALDASAAIVATAILSGVLTGMQQISAWWGKRRAYMHLMSLEDHLLKDIGISRSEIYGAVNTTGEGAIARNAKKRA